LKVGGGMNSAFNTLLALMAIALAVVVAFIVM
jgi:hypothetical protein